MSKLLTGAVCALGIAWAGAAHATTIDMQDLTPGTTVFSYDLTPHPYVTPQPGAAFMPVVLFDGGNIAVELLRGAGGTATISFPNDFTLNNTSVEHRTLVSFDVMTTSAAPYRVGLTGPWVTSVAGAWATITANGLVQFQFGEAGSDPGHVYIDNIVYTPSVIANVPEPATWAMMIVGMGMVGAGMRVRRRFSSVPARP